MVLYLELVNSISISSHITTSYTEKIRSSCMLNISSYSTSESSNNSSKRSTEFAISIFSLVLLFVLSRETWNVMAWDGLAQQTRTRNFKPGFLVEWKAPRTGKGKGKPWDLPPFPFPFPAPLPSFSSFLSLPDSFPSPSPLDRYVQD